MAAVRLHGDTAGVAGRPELHTIRTTNWIEGLLRTLTAGAAQQLI